MFSGAFVLPASSGLTHQARQFKQTANARLRSTRAASRRIVVTAGSNPKECDRQYRRTVFDFENWEQYRDTGRYVNNILTIPSSRIVRSVLPPTLWVMAVGGALGLYDTVLTRNYGFPPITYNSPEPLFITSFAISLLLVFRTNSSYARFDDARRLWGSILNRARDVVRQGQTFSPDENAESLDMLARWTLAHLYSLKTHLRSDGDIVKDIRERDLLSEEELDLLAKSGHRPLYSLQVMSELIHTMNMSPFHKYQMQDNVTFFHDTLGSCERILRTPIPLSYTRHTCRFLLIWLTFLPVALYFRLGLGVIPVGAVASMLLLGIEEIGVQIEEPFGILPLDAICDRAYIDVKEKDGMMVYGDEVKTEVAELIGAGVTDTARAQALARATN